MTRPVVGVVGIGAMGLGVALRLRDLGFEVHVRDVRPAQERLAASAGARVAPSPSDLAAACDVLLTLVVDVETVPTVEAVPPELPELFLPTFSLLDMELSLRCACTVTAWAWARGTGGPRSGWR